MITPPTSTNGEVGDQINELRRLFMDNEVNLDKKQSNLMVISQKLRELGARNYDAEFRLIQGQLGELLGAAHEHPFRGSEWDGEAWRSKFGDLKKIVLELVEVLPENETVNRRWEELMRVIERGQYGPTGTST